MRGKAAPEEAGGRASAPRLRRAKIDGAVVGGATGYVFVSGYFVLLAAFGIAPTAYALYLAVTTSNGHFTLLSNFIQSGEDFRFVSAFGHVFLYLVVWLAALVVLVLSLALALHGRARRASGVFRFVFYLPGALAGAASVLVWLFMLDPTVSPWQSVLRAFGLGTFAQTIQPNNLAFIFAVMAFWTGAGGWIVVMYGALNNISQEHLDAAAMDGANVFQTALHVKLPLIRKWVVYMLILAFAAGTQLFVEPQLVSQASLGAVTPSWSPNELAYVFAFQNDNFNYAAAVSIDLLVLAVVCAALLVVRSGLFDVE